jgi:hypothetical protein
MAEVEEKIIVEESETQKAVVKKEKPKAFLVEEIKYMNTNQLDAVLAEVAKRAVFLKKDKTGGAVKRLLSVFRKATTLTHTQLLCLDKIGAVLPSSKEEDMNYISSHLAALSKGETVRIGKAEFPWIREPLINFTTASNYTSDFMYYLIKLSPQKRAHLSPVIEKFAEINSNLLDIIKMTRNSRPKRGAFKKLKDVRADKKNSSTSKKTETEKASVSDAKKEVSPEAKKEEAQKTVEKKETQKTVEVVEKKS